MTGPNPATRREVSRFALVGVANTVVGVAVIFACYRLFGVGLILANAIGYGVGLALSFALNGAWTFGAARYSLTAIIKYAVLVAMAFAANILMINAGLTIGSAYWVAQMSGVVTYSAIVFLGMKYAVFRR